MTKGDALKIALRQWKSYMSERDCDDVENLDHHEADAFRACQRASEQVESQKPVRAKAPHNTPKPQGAEARIAAIITDMESKANESTVGVGLTRHWAKQLRQRHHV